jgi:hypothetical protein
MTTLHALVKGILEELRSHQDQPQPWGNDDEPFALPRMIGTGDGRLISVSKKVDRLIADIAHRKMKGDAMLESRFTAKDFREMVRRAFGPTLIKIDLGQDVDQNATQVLNDVEATLAREVEWIAEKGQREYAFGCTLFSYNDIAPFDVGPVRFEPRKIWLDRKASDGRWVRVESGGRLTRFTRRIADGSISKIARRRIIKTWQGLKLKKRKPSADSRNERHIVEAIGRCSYVCSVRVPGFGGEAGQEKAVISARLALAAVSLLWETPSTALDGFSLRAGWELRDHEVLSFTGDGLVLGGGGGSKRSHAPGGRRDELEEILKRYSENFAVAGEAISSFLDPTGGSARPKLMNAVAHALLWFSEGCRETVAQIALVKFSAAMEVLTGELSRKGSQKALRRLISSSFGIGDDRVIARDGMKMKELIELIYDEGRNRMIHGENEALGRDWSIWQAAAERLARDCIVLYMNRVAENLSIDDPKRLLQQVSG